MDKEKMTDRQKITNGILPCCDKKIRKYLTGTKFPMCEKCDCYFESVGWNNETVIKNEGAKALNNELWEEIKNNTEIGI